MTGRRPKPGPGRVRIDLSEHRREPRTHPMLLLTEQRAAEVRDTARDPVPFQWVELSER